MSVLYIKVLSDYYHHIIGDLEESRKNFLETFYNYLLENSSLSMFEITSFTEINSF